MNIDIYVLYQNINNPGRFIYGNVYSMFIINQEIRRNEIETKQTKRGERMKTYFDIINEHKEILISRIKSQVSDISYKNMNQIISLINDRFYIMIKEDLSDLINEVNE